MGKKRVYSELAAAIEAGANCAKTGNDEWFERWTNRVESLMAGAPSGSGFDSGTELDVSRSGRDKLVFTTAYHHMDDTGYYDGWTEHTITAKPDLLFGIRLTVSGRNRNDIKEYIHEAFESWLQSEAQGSV